MNQNETRGTMIQQGNRMRIDNALVEEVSYVNDNNGYLIVSYAVPERNNRVSIQTVRLNVDRNTRIVNFLGQSVCLCRIQPGMWVNAVFSANMTRSIPPQSNAFLISVQRRPQLLPPQRPSSVTTGRIVFVDFNNRFILTSDTNNQGKLSRFTITDATTFVNRFGIPIRFQSLRPGQLVRVTHANFQTLSIPPQTMAYQVQVLS